MLDDLLAQERYLERVHQIEQQQRIHQALAGQRLAHGAGTPIRVRVGRWLVASGQRLIEGA